MKNWVLVVKVEVWASLPTGFFAPLWCVGSPLVLGHGGPLGWLVQMVLRKLMHKTCSGKIRCVCTGARISESASSSQQGSVSQSVSRRRRQTRQTRH